VTTPLGRGDRSMTDHPDIIDLEPIRSHLFDHS